MMAFVLAVMGLVAFPIGTIVGAVIIAYLLTDEARGAFEPPMGPGAVPDIEPRAA
jgi:hypothetical protein